MGKENLNMLQDRNIKPESFFSITSPRERIAFLLQYAVLAPSTHNSQPWSFKIGDNFCEIIKNDEHPIIYADPKGRDIMISFGCLIENLVIAAKYFKVFKDVDYILETSLIARVNFINLNKSNLGSDETEESLLKAILYRVTARGIFNNEIISQEIVQNLYKLTKPDSLHLCLLENKSDIEKIGDLTRRGLVMAYKDKRFRKEMSEWFNHGLSLKPTGIPGYSLRMPISLSFVFSWIVRHFDIGKKLGELNYASICSAPLVAIITADENSEKNWLETGRYAENLMLQANAMGYKASIFTAAIEMGDLYKDIQSLIKTQQIPQFVIVIGRIQYNQKPNLRIAALSKIIQ
jgi:hypothetical protein